MQGGVQHRTRVHRHVVLAIRIAVSAALLTFLLSKAGIRTLGHTLSNASLAWLLAGLALGFAGSAAQITQWHGLLRSLQLKRSWLRCAQLEYAGNALDAALPTSIGGDLVRAYYAGEGPDRVAAATSVVLRRVCNLPGLVLIMGLATLVNLPNAYAARITPYATVGAVGGACVVALFTTPALSIFLNLKVFRGPRIGAIAVKLHAAVTQVRGRELAVAGGRGIVFWVIVSLSQYCYMRAVGVHVPIVYAALVVTTVNAISLLPISVGGYGLREGAFSAFLTVNGFAVAAQGVAVGVCLTGQTLLLGLLGFPVLISLRRRASANEVADAQALGAPLQESAAL
jgi:glycosyltransferase 2 family protein